MRPEHESNNPALRNRGGSGSGPQLREHLLGHHQGTFSAKDARIQPLDRTPSGLLHLNIRIEDTLKQFVAQCK